MQKTLDSPSMVWNGQGVSPYKMDLNVDASSESLDLDHLLQTTAAAARKATGGRLRWLVINCHGIYHYGCIGLSPQGVVEWMLKVPKGWQRDLAKVFLFCTPKLGFGIAIGGGIFQSSAHKFSLLVDKTGEVEKPLVENIYIVACGANAVTYPKGIESSVGKTGDGTALCSGIASAAKATVYCSGSLQPDNDTTNYPKNTVDALEGLVTIYGPDGVAIKPDPPKERRPPPLARTYD